MYVSTNPASKAALRRDLAEGHRITVFTVSPFESVPDNGTVTLEGPHYPQPHRWYGTGTIRDGVLVAVK